MEKIGVREYDAARYLNTEEEINEYLSACLDEFCLASFLQALRNIARARGMSLLAKDMGLSRSGLYKTLSPDNKPQFETILKITNALGVPLDVKPHDTGVQV